MKKNVLIISPTRNGYWEAVEQAVLSRGIQLLSVGSIREALYRVETEAFSVLILEDDAEGELQREFLRGLQTRPFGLLTPILVVGPHEQPRERALITSLLDQYFPASTEPQLLGEFVAETYELRGQKAKKGRLGRVSVPTILHQASRLRMTGAIVVERDEEKCVIYLEAGFMVFASSNRDENRFGEFLVARGIINRDQFHHAIRILEQGGKRLGRILVEEGFLKPQVLQTLLLSQIKHIVFTVFDWKVGEFYLLPDEQYRCDNPIARVDAPALIMEGIRFKFTEAQLDSEFAPFDAHVSPVMSPDDVQKRMRLSKDELDYMKLIGAGRPVGELLTLNSFSRLESLKLLYGFRTLGFLAVEKGVHPPVRALPSKDERAKAIFELFDEPKPAPPPAKVAPVPDKTVAPPKPRSWRTGYTIGAASMAVAFALVFTVFTLFDTRGSREGRTVEPHRIVVPDLVIETEQIKVVKAPEAAAPPAALTAAPVPVPTAGVIYRTPPLDPELQSLWKEAERARKQGRLHDALAAYRRIVEAHPRHTDSWIAMGDVLFDLDRSDEALEALRKAQALDASNPRPYLTMGTIYLMRDRKNEARSALKTYLSLVKSSPETRARITEVRRILQNLE